MDYDLFPRPPASDHFPRVPELRAVPMAFPWGTVAIWLPFPWDFADDMTDEGAPNEGLMKKTVTLDGMPWVVYEEATDISEDAWGKLP